MSFWRLPNSWMSKRRLKNILCLLRVTTQNVFLTFFVRSECLKDVSKTACAYWEWEWKQKILLMSSDSWMSKRRLRYVMIFTDSINILLQNFLKNIILAIQILQEWVSAIRCYVRSCWWPEWTASIKRPTFKQRPRFCRAMSF